MGGGGTRDEADYAGSVAAVSVTFDDVANDGAGGENDNVRSSVEGATTGIGDDTIVGSPADNLLQRGAGNDTITGGAGDDDVQGFSGNDVLSGESGDDTIRGDSGADALSGGDGNDFLSPGQILVGVPDGADTVSGGSGIDAIDPGVSGAGGNRVTLIVHARRHRRRRHRRRRRQLPRRSRRRRRLRRQRHVDYRHRGHQHPRTDVRQRHPHRRTGQRHPELRRRQDTIFARDGFADVVECGVGNDIAIVDTLDWSARAARPSARRRRQRQRGRAADGRVRDPAENALMPARASTVTVTPATPGASRASCSSTTGRSSGSTPRRRTSSPTSPRPIGRRQERAHRPGGRRAGPDGYCGQGRTRRPLHPDAGESRPSPRRATGRGRSASASAARSAGRPA